MLIIAQNITVNIQSFHLILSIILAFVAVLTFAYRVKKGREVDMQKKVDCTDFNVHLSHFNEFRRVTSDNLTRKVDRDIFERFEKEVIDDLKLHENSNALAFKLINEEIKESRKVQTELLTAVKEVLTDMKWVKQNINK